MGLSLLKSRMLHGWLILSEHQPVYSRTNSTYIRSSLPISYTYCMRVRKCKASSSERATATATATATAHIVTRMHH